MNFALEGALHLERTQRSFVIEARKWKAKNKEELRMQKEHKTCTNQQ
jgi:hypothetical protein